MAERNLNAYYYHFKPTGNDAIDAILEAVAKAGKGCHHTADWGIQDDSGLSYIDKIQTAANEGANPTRESGSV